jgi:hypothetical protein
MYAKVFSQIFDSSISEDHVMRHVFMDLLVLANRDGEVDMTAEAIARRTNVPIDVVCYSLKKLSDADPRSRTGDEEGRRIVLLDEHRDWGWRIVNYRNYRDMRDEEARKAYFREYKRSYRNNSSPTLSTPVLDSPTLSTNTPTDTNTPKKQKSSESELKVIYESYPRHVGKAAALKAISKALTVVPFETLLLRTQTYCKQVFAEQIEERFIPHPATWFNRGSYEDEGLIPKPKREYKVVSWDEYNQIEGQS